MLDLPATTPVLLSWIYRYLHHPAFQRLFVLLLHTRVSLWLIRHLHLADSNVDALTMKLAALFPGTHGRQTGLNVEGFPARVKGVRTR